MLKTRPLELLRHANPAPVATASALGVAIDLHERVLAAIAWEDCPAEPAPPRPRSLTLPTLTRVRAALLAGAALVAVLVVAPAFGLIRGVIPFFDAPKAPQPVQVEFASMNTGAPSGMSPQAIADNTREIGQFSFAGRMHTLWVAPTKQGGFCFEWIGGWGGCTAPTPDPLTWNGDLVIPAGVPAPSMPAPSQLSHVAASVMAADVAAMLKARSLAVPTWISGYVSASDAQDVMIKFSDGTTVHPEIVWVSQPIGAGFFSYEVPAQYQTEANHLVAVDALTAGGAIVTEQPLRR
jgi:hypothetical protein